MSAARGVLACAVALTAACTACTAGTRDPAAGAETTRSPNVPLSAPVEFGQVRLVLAADRAHTEPVYVQLNAESSQVGWVTLFRGDERVYLQERCELADCGQPPAVCGAAIPMVRNIGGSSAQRHVEFTWDGRTSVRTTAGCETRPRVTSTQPLRARFCWSSRAQVDGSGNPASGRVVEPTCVERALAASDTVLVVSVPR